ncbi:MAG: acetyl-CoA carboxylase biotin carboxyl carrier protein [Kiritimatiellaeota bacterium]|nr:acetyl-CoA carboxylase biotin carboxyl carrier protein [Kiritimatiellota bacterium]
MKIDEIRTIVQLMSKHELTEFKIEAEEMRLCIKRAGNGVAAAPVGQMMAQPMAAPVSQAAPQVADAPADEPTSAVDRITIDSPIVGTFYAAPSPEAESLVKIGTQVSPDTVVCIIEAMKVMNEIKAEKSGVIKEFLIDNAQPVEFGQPLFVIE